MTLKNILTNKKEGCFSSEEPGVAIELSRLIKEWIPAGRVSDIVIVCIGTDRSTGDSLGPLTGTLISQQKAEHFTVYGTLESPVHAVNLEETVEFIHKHHVNPYVIAIDASLGKLKSIGSIVAAKGPVKPGAALKKPLPAVGDMHINGVVNMSGYMEFFVLQNTRLHVVMELAQKIAATFRHLDLLLNESTRTIQTSRPLKKRDKQLFSNV